MSDFKTELAARTKEVEDIIIPYLPKVRGREKVLLEAMNYSVLAGGKRLRPLLMLETFRMFKGVSSVVEPFMIAIEMIHTYSLVHDDLPAMDNDDLRRGKPTTHKKYGEAMGVLCGDALLNTAMERVLSAFYMDPDNRGIVPALRLLFAKAGMHGMIGGQVVDVEGEKTGVAPDYETLAFIYENKTAALIEAAMMVGAQLAGAKDVDVETIGKAASKIGIAFQIRDDILDITGEEAQLGKPVGSDAKNDKVTMAALLGIEEAEKEVRRLSGEARAMLLPFAGEDAFLLQLVSYLIDRKN